MIIGRDLPDIDQKARWLKEFLPSLAQVPAQMIRDRLRERSWLVGTPEEVAEQLAACSTAGVQRVMLQYFDLDDTDGLVLLAEVARAVA